MADNLQAFFAENAMKAAEVDYAASARFRGTDGKVVAWRLRPLTGDEHNEIMNRCKTKKTIPGTREISITVDNEKFTDEIICASVVFPNLNNEALQNSYGAVGAAECVRKMLTAGEYTDLFMAIMQTSGFQQGMDDKIKRAKN